MNININIILDKLTEYLTCPQTTTSQTTTLMTDPVITAEGTTIERGDDDARSNLKIKQMLEVRKELEDKVSIRCL